MWWLSPYYTGAGGGSPGTTKSDMLTRKILKFTGFFYVLPLYSMPQLLALYLLNKCRLLLQTAQAIRIPIYRVTALQFGNDNSAAYHLPQVNNVDWLYTDRTNLVLTYLWLPVRVIKQ